MIFPPMNRCFIHLNLSKRLLLHPTHRISMTIASCRVPGPMKFARDASSATGATHPAILLLHERTTSTMAPVANASNDSSQRLAELRTIMNEHGVDAYIIPSEDAHQSEYIADVDKRRAWICGFTGSAGVAVVTQNEACMWTDGRYFLQASKEMDKNWTLMKMGLPDVPSKEDWLSKSLSSGSCVGLDAKLISVGKSLILLELTSV
jgi:hypothetical protein